MAPFYGWSTLEPPSGFEHGTPGLGIFPQLCKSFCLYFSHAHFICFTNQKNVLQKEIKD